MNDEDFARTVLTDAFPTTSEPGMALDLDQLVRDGRRGTRIRRVGLATGGTAAAGVVVLAAWGVSTLGSGDASTSVGPAAGSSVTKPSPSEPDKNLKGDQCTTTVDLGAIVEAALPSGVSVAESSDVGCHTFAGHRQLDVGLKLKQPQGSLSVSVDTKTGAAVPSDQAVAASKMSAGQGQPPGGQTPVCHAVTAGTACITHFAKGSVAVTLVTLSTTGSQGKAIALSVAGPETGGPVPFSDASLTDVAESVAAHV